MNGILKHAALAAAITLTSAAALHAQSTDTTNVRPRRPFPDSAGGAMRGRMGPMRDGFRGGPGGPMRGFGPMDGPNGGMRGGMRGGMHGGMRGGMHGALMRGITLSDAQEKALRAVHVKQITALKPLQVELVSARADAQIAQLNGDQKGLDAANARLEAARDKLHKQMEERSPVNDLRGVLTPDQQKLLDRNLQEGMRTPAAGEGMRRGPRGGERGFGPRGFGPGNVGPGVRERRMMPRPGGELDDEDDFDGDDDIPLPPTAGHAR